MRKPPLKLRSTPGTVSKATHIELVEDVDKYKSKGYKKFLVKDANRRLRHDKSFKKDIE